MTTGVKARDRVRLLRNAWRASADPLDRRAARNSPWHQPSDAFRIRMDRAREPREGARQSRPRARRRSPTCAWRSPSLVMDRSERRGVARRPKRFGVADQLFHGDGVVPRADRVFAAFDVIVLEFAQRGNADSSARGDGRRCAVLVAFAVGGVPDVVSDVEARIWSAPVMRANSHRPFTRCVHDRPAAAAARAIAARRRLDCNFGVAPWLDEYRDLYVTAAAARGAS